jgi:L-amino acid N-acyltransferase YncA
MNSIRLATLNDLPRLVEIYNQAISAHNATADTVPFVIGQRRAWFDSHLPDSYPIYVYEFDHLVLGYLSISPYRDRPALVRTAEVSYYVDYGFHGRGIGSSLMDHALADCSQLGKHILLAILLECNQASIRLLEKFNFEKWGFLPEVAEFSGALYGHLYYGRKMV